MNKDEFKIFFEPYSKNVDNAGKLAFWRLSDTIIRSIIRSIIPEEGADSITILDAGGGTGRWAIELSKIYPYNFIVYDLSEDMLHRAKANIKSANCGDRIQVMQGDLTDMGQIPSNSIDYVTSIYSPISFVEKKERAIDELYRILKPGGIILIMGHGYYNAIASKINNYSADPKELNELAGQYLVHWAPHVPALNVFSKETMELLLIQSGFKPLMTYGIPVFVQPGPEDFDPENAKKSKISSALENQNFFDTVLGLEMQYNQNPEVANRGMNIFSIVKK